MSISKEVYAGYIEVDVDFDSFELLEHMADAGVSIDDILQYFPDDAIVFGLREHLCGDDDDPVVHPLLEQLEKLVKDARAKHERVVAAAKEVQDGA